MPTINRRVCRREGCPYEGKPTSDRHCPDCGRPTKFLSAAELAERGDIRVCRTKDCGREGMATSYRTCSACGRPTEPQETGRWP